MVNVPPGLSGKTFQLVDAEPRPLYMGPAMYEAAMREYPAGTARLPDGSLVSFVLTQPIPEAGGA